MTRTRHHIVMSVAVLALLSACTGSTIGSKTPAAELAAPPSAQLSTTSDAPATSAPASTTSAACSSPFVEPAEGPFNTPDAPERTDITDESTVGIPLPLTGCVLAADCSPVAGTMIEFWQADGAGVDDNEGYSLRGRQVTTSDGEHTLQTVIPRQYLSRSAALRPRAPLAKIPPGV